MTPIFEEAGRPSVLRGTTKTLDTPEGRVYVTLNFHEGEPVEVFITIGRTGSTARAYAEAVGRLCSVSLQRGVPLRVLTNQLRGISSEETYGFGPNRILSVPDAVSRILQGFLPEKEDDNVRETSIQGDQRRPSASREDIPGDAAVRTEGGADRSTGGPDA